MTDNNIIRFPNTPDNVSDLPTTHQEVVDRVAAVRVDYVDFAMDMLRENLLLNIQQFGFRLGEDRKSEKDWCFICEAIESALYRSSGIKHYMQPIAEKTIRFEDEPVKKTRKRKMKNDDPSQTKDNAES